MDRVERMLAQLPRDNVPAVDQENVVPDQVNVGDGDVVSNVTNPSDNRAVDNTAVDNADVGNADVGNADVDNVYNADG